MQIAQRLYEGIDLDGETVGRLPLEVSVLPRAFAVGAP